jgi:hypothetical protein
MSAPARPPQVTIGIEGGPRKASNISLVVALVIAAGDGLPVLAS